MTDDARWPARHFDGETPAPRTVGVGLEPGALIVTDDAMEGRRWPLDSVVIVNGGGRSGPVQLELRGERTESLVVTGPVPVERVNDPTLAKGKTVVEEEGSSRTRAGGPRHGWAAEGGVIHGGPWPRG